MNALTLLAELERQGATFSVDGERLSFHAPKGVMTANHRKVLGENRDTVMAELRERAGAGTQDYPLSHNQEAVWLLQHSAPASAANNLSVAVRINMALNLDTAQQAMQHVVDRHPALRTTYHMNADGVLCQRVARTGTALVELFDVRDVAEDARRAMAQADRDRPFDLQTGPMLRLSVYHCGELDQVLLLTAHHIGADGLSMLTLFLDVLRETRDIAHGVRSAPEPPQGTYIDYVRREARFVDSPAGAKVLDYWRAQLAEPRASTELPTDRPRPAVPTLKGASVPVEFDAPTSAALKALARTTGATAFVVLLAGYHMFLARLTGMTDVTVGTSVSQRFQESEYPVVGDYVNALPLRARMRWDMSFTEVIGLLRDATLGALDAQAYPVQLLVNQLRPQRGHGASPFFNAFFTFQQFEMARDFAALAAGYGRELELQGYRLQPYWLPNQSGQFDLTLALADFEDLYRGGFHYATDLFDQSTVARHARDYVAFVSRLAADPGTTLMAAAERRDLLAMTVPAATTTDPAPFVTQLRRCAGTAPDRAALRFGADTLSYAALDRQSEALAHELRRRGVAPGSMVGLHAERTPAMVLALLAIGKAGGTYVPLDPGFPDIRLTAMIEDSGMTMLLTEHGGPSWLPPNPAMSVLDLHDLVAAAAEAGSASTPLDDPAPNGIAYLLYTSGSTGSPNGIPVTHAALSNFLGGMRALGLVAADDVLAAVTTISFDIAGLELYLPLLCGATVALVPREVSVDGLALAEALAECGATVMQATPATWQMLLDAEWTLPPGFKALCGGDTLRPDLAAALRARTAALWNLYGPTETTIWSAAGPVGEDCAVTVGKPVANTQIFVLDADQGLVPAGVEGEVWIGGAGLSPGYWTRPALTAARFAHVAIDAAAPVRLYHTGDVGAWTPDGRLVIRGRSDQQMKLRGFRIEPAEIEAVLAQHPDVRGAVVAVQGPPSDLRLVAYVAYKQGAEPITSELRRHVRLTLPDYMVPALFVEIDAIPLTPNGKIDRRALPDPFAESGRVTSAVYAEPEDGLEQTLAGIWSTLLQVDRISANDNFFERGGHSLLALRVAAALKQQADVTVEPRDMFFLTLRQVAARIASPTGAEPASGL